MPTSEKSLAGRLLVSHPMQRDNDFCETVVLIHTHTAKDGAMGVILNRPSHRLLGQAQVEFAEGALANLPIHVGGPVGTNRLAFGGWKFGARGPASIRYGISREEAADLATAGDYKLFAFVGYAGWSPGQLENELRLNAWVVCPFERSTATLEERDFWKTLLAYHRPDLRLVLDSPTNPELN
jgi:putative transcriptional regulator